MSEPTDVLALTPPQVAELSYEQARAALDVVVGALEDAEVPLEELMRLWELGELLATACEAALTRARERLEAAAPTPET